MHFAVLNKQSLLSSKIPSSWCSAVTMRGQQVTDSAVATLCSEYRLRCSQLLLWQMAIGKAGLAALSCCGARQLAVDDRKQLWCPQAGKPHGVALGVRQGELSTILLPFVRLESLDLNIESYSGEGLEVLSNLRHLSVPWLSVHTIKRLAEMSRLNSLSVHFVGDQERDAAVDLACQLPSLTVSRSAATGMISCAAVSQEESAEIVHQDTTRNRALEIVRDWSISSLTVYASDTKLLTQLQDHPLRVLELWRSKGDDDKLLGTLATRVRLDSLQCLLLERVAPAPVLGQRLCPVPESARAL